MDAGSSTLSLRIPQRAQAMEHQRTQASVHHIMAIAIVINRLFRVHSCLGMSWHWTRSPLMVPWWAQLQVHVVILHSNFSIVLYQHAPSPHSRQLTYTRPRAPRLLLYIQTAALRPIQSSIARVLTPTTYSNPSLQRLLPLFLLATYDMDHDLPHRIRPIHLRDRLRPPITRLHAAQRSLNKSVSKRTIASAPHPKVPECVLHLFLRWRLSQLVCVEFARLDVRGVAERCHCFDVLPSGFIYAMTTDEY